MSFEDEMRIEYFQREKILDNSRDQIENIDAILKDTYNGKDKWKIIILEEIKDNLQDMIEYLE